MEREISIAEARNKLTAVVREAEKGLDFKLTRRGKPVAVLLSCAEYSRLCGAKGRFWDSFLSLVRLYDIGLNGMTDADFDGLRDQSQGRDVDV